MPEIGYWKYVRFNDDEPQYWGTDDDIVQIFDSADDRLEYRMKKDIRYEDDVGNEILTLDKANRHVEIPVQLNVAALEEYAVGAGITVKGTLTFSGADLDLAGNLLKNLKLGTDLKTAGYNICHGVYDSGKLALWGGSTPSFGYGACIDMYGSIATGNEGMLRLIAAKINNVNARVRIYTPDTVPSLQERVRVNQGDAPDVDILNAKLDFHDQTLEATAGAIAGYFRLKVGDTEYKVPAYALA